MDVACDVAVDDRGATLAPLLGLSGFGPAAFMETVNPGGLPGDAGGFSGAMLFTIVTQAVASATRCLGGRLLTSPRGYYLRTTGTHTGLIFSAVNGSNTFVNSPTFPLTAAEVGKPLLATFAHTGTLLRLWLWKLEASSGTAISGFAPATAPTRFGFATTGLVAATDTIIHGMALGLGAPAALADVEAYADAVKSARGIVRLPWATSRITYPVVTNTKLDDAEGGSNMSLVGSLTLNSEPNPAFP